MQLLLQDGIQYLMHLVEHKLDPRLYKASHKPHHKFTNPRLFDAFNGSATGTNFTNLIPYVIRVASFNIFNRRSLMCGNKE